MLTEMGQILPQDSNGRGRSFESHQVIECILSAVLWWPPWFAGYIHLLFITLHVQPSMGQLLLRDTSGSARSFEFESGSFCMKQTRQIIARHRNKLLTRKMLWGRSMPQGCRVSRHSVASDEKIMAESIKTRIVFSWHLWNSGCHWNNSEFNWNKNNKLIWFEQLLIQKLCMKVGDLTKN